jgi:hypothetical protein
MHSRRSVLASLAGCLGAGYRGGTVAFEGGFESGTEGWSIGASIGPEEPLEAFEREAGVSSEQAAAGERSLRLFTEGDHDDGAVWATHEIPVEPGRRYVARVTLQA